MDDPQVLVPLQEALAVVAAGDGAAPHLPRLLEATVEDGADPHLLPLLAEEEVAAVGPLSLLREEAGILPTGPQGVAAMVEAALHQAVPHQAVLHHQAVLRRLPTARVKDPLQAGTRIPCLILRTPLALDQRLVNLISSMERTPRRLALSSFNC